MYKIVKKTYLGLETRLHLEPLPSYPNPHHLHCHLSFGVF